MKRKLCTLLAAAQLAQLSACTTLSEMPPGRGALQPGETIHITTAVNQYQMRVDSVNADEICGSGKCIRIADIGEVRREEFSIGRTAGLVGGALAVLVLGTLMTRGSFLQKK